MTRVKVQRILLVNTGSFGDVIRSGALPYELKRRLPKAQIVWLTTPEGGEVLQNHRWVNWVVVPPADGTAGLFALARSLSRHRFDLAITLDDGFRGAAAAWLSGARYRLGRGEAGRITSLLLTHVVHPRQAYVCPTERSLEVLDILQIRPGSLAPLLELAPHDITAGTAVLRESGLQPGVQFAVVSPGCDAPYKRWPADHFAAVVDRLYAKYGLPAVLLGAGRHARILERVAHRCVAQPRVLAGRTTLLQAAGILKSARIFISVDTGLVPLATAVGTPTVAVFSGASGTHVPEERVTAVCEASSPTGTTKYPGIVSVQPNEVMRAVDEWLCSPVPWALK
ncbi:MAG: glycosyltransferase family 9 protein [Armatimonadota bacterium]